ncbi:putative reverse transcriptase domain-containing protein, partial [Tanacetum coccineum]
MMTRSAGQPTAASRGGGTGGRASSGGLEVILVIRVMVGLMVRVAKNQNSDAVNDNIQGDVSRGCTYKEFLAYNPKKYDGKAGYAAYTDKFHELARLVPHLVTPERMDPSKRTLRREEIGGEPSKDRNVRDDNKSTRTGNAFATTANPVRGGLGHFAKDCRVVPRNVNPINVINPVAKTCYKCSSADHIKATCPRNQGNQARGRAFMLGLEEARQDPNIVTGTFTLNDHYATTLFDSGADYSFVSTTFIPLLGIEPSDLSFNYEIKIASRQLVEIDKVIKGCKLEIEGHVFDINLIPFGSGSFDVIIGTDWLSDHKAEIIYNEKVVRIPLLYGKVFRVLGEKPEENVRQLMSAGTKEHKKEEIVVVRDFLESPYRLAPSELENFRTKVSFDQAYRLGEHR